MLTIVVLVAVIIAIVMYCNLKKKKKKAEIRGWVKSQDLHGKGERVYRNHQAGISAKPDVVEGNRVIEYKSAEAKNKAYRSDVLQVAAEMRATGLKEAELRFAKGKKFAFKKQSQEIQSAMKQVDWIARKMRWHLASRTMPRGTLTPNKCAKCIFRNECSQAA
jgi:CRISPR/Cas system-associated exonuclease Cas4 (RecB family)